MYELRLSPRGGVCYFPGELIGIDGWFTGAKFISTRDVLLPTIRAIAIPKTYTAKQYFTVTPMISVLECTCKAICRNKCHFDIIIFFLISAEDDTSSFS